MHPYPCPRPRPGLPALVSTIPSPLLYATHLLPAFSDASGTTRPDPQLVQELTSLPCTSAQQWAYRLSTAVEAGGRQAQAAVAAFNQSGCTAVMQPLIDSLFKSTPSGDFQAVKQ